MRRFKPAPGHETRGMMIRVYPTHDQVAALDQIERDLRHAWNWLVGQTEDWLCARAAYAVREGFAAAKPERPDYDGMGPEDAKLARLKHNAAIRDWAGAVHAATKDVPCCQPRKFRELLAHFGCKHDYQLLGRVVRWGREAAEVDGDVRLPGAHLLQALAKNYFQKSDRRKKRRRSVDSMPIQTKSGACFELGEFGERGATHKREGKPRNFYDCQITINGLKFRGRLPGRVPAGRVLEGASLTKRADGWWASIKVEAPVREMPAPEPGTVIGIDVGLDMMVAMSDGTLVPNPRDKVYAERIAGRQALGKPTQRLQQQMHRRVVHELHNRVVKPLARVEIIKVEKLQAHIGQMGSTKVSVMRTVVGLLKQRYGDRVREVDPRYTSQDCSQCGHRSKESWSYEHGRRGRCPACGYSVDRDINAARNVAAKAA